MQTRDKKPYSKYHSSDVIFIATIKKFSVVLVAVSLNSLTYSSNGGQSFGG